MVIFRDRIRGYIEYVWKDVRKKCHNNRKSSKKDTEHQYFFCAKDRNPRYFFLADPAHKIIMSNGKTDIRKQSCITAYNIAEQVNLKMKVVGKGDFFMQSVVQAQLDKPNFL